MQWLSPPRLVHLCACAFLSFTFPSGIAACNIGGITIHSFAGIGHGEDEVDTLIARVRKNRKANTRWARTKVLIIDEGTTFVYSAFSGLTAA